MFRRLLNPQTLTPDTFYHKGHDDEGKVLFHPILEPPVLKRPSFIVMVLDRSYQIMSRILIPFFLLLLYGTFVVAQDADIDDDLSDQERLEIQQAIDEYQGQSWTLGVAAGYGVRTNPLIHSSDIPLYAVFDVSWFGDNLFFDNGDLGLSLHETDKLSVSLMAHINNERGVFEWLNNSSLGVQLPEFLGNHTQTFTASDPLTPASETEIEDDLAVGFPVESSESRPQTNQSTKIPHRSFAVDLGIEVIYADFWGDLQLQVLSDVSFTHKGYEVWASYAYPWQYGAWSMTPSFGANWKSRDLLDYYYGVRDSEVKYNRPSYQASSGFNYFARLAVSYRINEHWGVVGVAEYEGLSRSIRQSPLVNSSHIDTLFIGLMYQF